VGSSSTSPTADPLPDGHARQRPAQPELSLGGISSIFQCKKANTEALPGNKTKKKK